MESLMAYKIEYNGSLLNDLPTELKYRVLDLLEPTTLKKCRLINKTYQECIDTCEKYNKYWILDVFGWPVTTQEKFVEVFSNGNINIGHFVCSRPSSNGIFFHVPELFQKLGETVTTIDNLPFDDFDDSTVVSIVKHFKKVEELSFLGVSLLKRMNRLHLVWPSIKRLTITVTHECHYEGNFSEIPNAKEIIIRYIGIGVVNAVEIIMVCPQKVTGIENLNTLNNLLGGDPCIFLHQVPNLKLKFARLAFANTVCQQKFFDEQTAMETCEITTFYDLNKRLLPDNLNPSFVTVLAVKFMSGCTIDKNSLKSMRKLKKFAIFLNNYFYGHQLQICFLDSHDFEDKFPKVTSLIMSKLHVTNACFKCIKVLLTSFPNLTELVLDVRIDEKDDFYRLWKKLNKTLKKTGVNVRLIDFCIENVSKSEIDLNEYNAFDILAPLPNVKNLELAINWTNVTQNNFTILYDKCPALKSFKFGIKQKFDFNLTGYIIHQWYDLKELVFIDKDNHLTASKDIIATLMNVPLKLSALFMPIKCEATDVFPLFHKFPTLRSVQIVDRGILKEIHPVHYWRHIRAIDDSSSE